MAKYGTDGASLLLALRNIGAEKYTVKIIDNSYKTGNHMKEMGAAGSPTATATVHLNLVKSFRWYDFTVKVNGKSIFEKTYAGRIEMGKPNFADPLMGRGES